MLQISVGDPLNTIFNQFSKINSREILPKNSDSLKEIQPKLPGISGDLFFNSLAKIYLSQYRRNEGSAAPEIFFEKSTQPEVYLRFFGLSVTFLFVKWQLREAVEIICEREVSTGKETLKKMQQISKPWAEGLFPITFCQFVG